jgi:hypothetical protein
MVKDTVLGGADLNPKRKYKGALKILLTMDQSRYEQRRARRDADYPEKANQKAHTIEDWIHGAEYDAVMNVDDRAEISAMAIYHLMRPSKKGG